MDVNVDAAGEGLRPHQSAAANSRLHALQHALSGSSVSASASLAGCQRNTVSPTCMTDGEKVILCAAGYRASPTAHQPLVVTFRLVPAPISHAATTRQAAVCRAQAWEGRPEHVRQWRTCERASES